MKRASKVLLFIAILVLSISLDASKIHYAIMKDDIPLAKQILDEHPYSFLCFFSNLGFVILPMWGAWFVVLLGSLVIQVSALFSAKEHG